MSPAPVPSVRALKSDAATAQKHNFPLPRTLHSHSHAHQALPLPGPLSHLQWVLYMGLPLPSGPETLALRAHPHLPPSQRLGAVSSPALLGGQLHTPPLLPTDILESPLISLEGAAQPPPARLPGRCMAKPWRQPPPPNPWSGESQGVQASQAHPSALCPGPGS